MDKTSKILRKGLILIYIIVFIFLIIWFIKPAWLENLSEQGKIMEAMDSKHTGDELLRQKQYQAAYTAYDKALSIIDTLQSAALGKAIAAFHSGKEAETWLIIDNLLKNEPDKPWEIYNSISGFYLSKKDTIKAVKNLKAAYEISPEQFSSALKLARFHYNDRDWQRAKDWYQKTLLHLPGMKNDYITMLKEEKYVFANNTQITQALEKYLQAGYTDDVDSLYYRVPVKSKKLKQYKMEIYHNIGYSSAALGEFDEAVRWLQKALELDPDNKELQLKLDRAKADLQKQKLK